MSAATSLTAVVLAGSEAKDPLVVQAGVPTKALFPLNGRPMVAYLLAALRACEPVPAIVYVGTSVPELSELHDVVVPSGTRLIDSLEAGLAAGLAAGAQRLLLVGADIPWVTGPMLTRFLAAADPAAGLVYPIVPEAAAAAQFPEQRRTYVRLREGRFTGGNLALLSSQAVGGLLPLIERLYRARKNPLALAGIVGLDVLAALIAGRASLPGLEQRVSALLGARARALVTQDAALAADVDDLSHLPAAALAALAGAPEPRGSVP